MILLNPRDKMRAFTYIQYLSCVKYIFIEFLLNFDGWKLNINIYLVDCEI